MVTATAADLSNRVEKPTECLYHANSGQAPSYPGDQSTSTTVGAPVTTSLSKDDTVVQAAMGDRLTGAIFLVMFTNETETASCFYPLKAHASSFPTRALVLVEGRTLRSADNDRFTLQYKTNSRKGSLMESNRGDLQQIAGFQLAPGFSWQTMFRHSETPISFRELCRFSSRHCA